jgi:hypothetical protein
VDASTAVVVASASCAIATEGDRPSETTALDPLRSKLRERMLHTTVHTVAV